MHKYGQIQNLYICLLLFELLIFQRSGKKPRSPSLTSGVTDGTSNLMENFSVKIKIAVHWV